MFVYTDAFVVYISLMLLMVDMLQSCLLDACCWVPAIAMCLAKIYTPANSCNNDPPITNIDAKVGEHCSLSNINIPQYQYIDISRWVSNINIY